MAHGTRSRDADLVQLRDAGGKIESEPQPPSREGYEQPLQQADQEIEQDIGNFYAKEAERLDASGGDNTTDAAANFRDKNHPEYVPQGNAGDDEGGLEGTVPEGEALAEQGEDMGEMDE